MRTQVQLGYTLGTSLLLSAVVYFYASNWGALSRWEKLAPLFAAIAVMYILSEVLARRPGRAFLSRLALLACCLFFGVGLALIGQTYNSHADSYSLFALWLVPALLFALLTRWQPFSILAYILGHLAYLFYFFPSLDSGRTSELRSVTVLAVLTVLNLLVLAGTERRLLASPVLRLLSFGASFFLLLYISEAFSLGGYGRWLNIPLLLMLGLAVFYYHRTRNKMLLLLSGLCVSVMTVVKYFRLLVHFADESFILWSMLFVVLFVWGNVRFLRYLRSLPSAAASEEQGEDAGEERTHYVKWAARVLMVSVIAIGTILGTATVVGFLIIILEIEHPENVLAVLGGAVVIGTIAAKRLNSIVRYTLMTGGVILGMAAALILDSLPLMLLFLVLMVTALVFITGTVQRIYFFVIAESIAGIVLNDLLEDGVGIFATLGAVLLVVLLGTALFVKQQGLRTPLLYGSYPSFLLVFFILTFITEGPAYYLCNVLFFLTVTAAVFLGNRASLAWVYGTSLPFWIAFLVYKYYDLAWKLLHKSFSLAVAGVILLAATMLYERRQGAGEQPALRTGQRRSTVWVLAGLAVLQLAVMSAQIARNEGLLANGQVIKLQLVPLDPRSLLQGDYVHLSFTISRPDWSDAQFEPLNDKPKATLVLAPDAAGVYQLVRLHEEHIPLKEGEVLIRGKWDGYRQFQYGIEQYFIPEGTGLEVERTAQYAEVKVSASGDAILVRLLGG
ncbi:MAG: hypothetical protein K0R57_1645 [Paenibacillaceae bacterium]|jgi:uncharacterized membrane-anchored protein/uncharacterized membrane protein|nr:hypothetical protein [Paenibacillaceae bacterium]